MNDMSKFLMNIFLPGNQLFDGKGSFASDMKSMGDNAQLVAPVVGMINPIAGAIVGGAGTLQSTIAGKVMENKQNNSNVINITDYITTPKLGAGAVIGDPPYSNWNEINQSLIARQPLPSGDGMSYPIDVVKIAPRPVPMYDYTSRSNTSNTDAILPEYVEPNPSTWMNEETFKTMIGLVPNIINYFATRDRGVAPATGAPGSSTNNNDGGYSALLKKANTANYIGAGLQALVGGIGLFNEMNAEKSEDARMPSMKDVTLDKDQSSFINAMDAASQMTSNAQSQYAKQMGMDPGMISSAMFLLDQNSKLRTLAQADQTRQTLAAKEAEINSRMKEIAVQGKMQTDQFNIQKQMTENQISSENTMGSMMAMISAYPKATQANLNNRLAFEYLAKQ